MTKIEEFYCPAVPTTGIDNKVITYMESEDMAFVQQLVEDTYLFEAAQFLFHDPKSCKQLDMDSNTEKVSAYNTITRALSRRTDRCCLLVKEITENEYSEDIIRKVEKDVSSFMLHIRPLILDEADLENNEALLITFLK
jgi:hypothetical protein